MGGKSKKKEDEKNELGNMRERNSPGIGAGKKGML